MNIDKKHLKTDLKNVLVGCVFFALGMASVEYMYKDWTYISPYQKNAECQSATSKADVAKSNLTEE
ncbi:hypothetical protein AB4428_06435 [Vibrio lentus]